MVRWDDGVEDRGDKICAREKNRRSYIPYIVNYSWEKFPDCRMSS